ncbi:MAG: SpoIID/LytB domain-containing protein [Gordonia sp. (in: high G+C Gram-positive bacteria)]
MNLLTSVLARRVRPRDVRRRRASVVLGGAASALIAAGAAVIVPAVADHPPGIGLTAAGSYTLVGHGHGHGRGMGQWGAYGYAKKGWPAALILNHFYGGTVPGLAANQVVTVVLSGQQTVAVRADAGALVAGQRIEPGQAVSINGNTATVTAGCGGTVVRTIAATFVDPINGATARPDNELLRFCGGGAYRGSLGLAGGRVVNRLNVDDYVKGVIPRESSPSWADGGGAEALKAQAIAARTYALASIARGKVIDDTQGSQVYGGASGEDPRTNAAADATAGRILLKGGAPAFTEFSASTGGYTAGGEFPAVVDEGDVLSPSHNWTQTVTAGRIASAFGLGAVDSIEVIEANGLGAENGRALRVRATGGGRSVEVSGEEARTRLGLPSSWFAVQGQSSAPRIATPPTGGLGSLDSAVLMGLIPDLGDLPGSDVLEAATTAFRTLFEQLGGLAGPLGQATGAPTRTADGAGVTQAFGRGMMFFSRQTGAQALAGSALTRFEAAGGVPAQGFPRRTQVR